MDPSTRVCPFCGEPPGAGVFCAACGRNLAGVDRLPTAEEWQGPGSAMPGASPATATAAFLEAMHAAGDPGATQIPVGKPSGLLGRSRHVQGWVVRPVDREDFDGPKRYEPGLVLTVDGRYHQLDNELRGWGQRDFPRYHQTASVDPIDVTPDERLARELASVRAANDISR
jgi:hypothetical protein